MTVYGRDYARDHGCAPTGKRVWAYAFTYQKRRYRKTGFRTKSEALLAEERRRKEVILDRREIIPSRKATFSQIVPKYLDFRRDIRSKNTVDSDRRVANRLSAVMGVRTMDSISVADLKLWQSSRLRSGVCNRTVNIETIFLRGFFGYAVEHGYAPTNPAKSLPALREVKRDKCIPTDEEFRRFVAEAATTRAGRQLVTWIMVAAYTGTRPNECSHLEWADIDLVQDRIFIRPKEHHQTKTGRFRVVEIHPELKTTLVNWKREWDQQFGGMDKPHDWVFVQPGCPQQRARGFRKSFDRAKRQAGLASITPYTLRHYFISKAVMSGVDLFTISKWVGHSSTHMIETVYGHLSDEHRRKQMAKLHIGSGSERDGGGEILKW